MSPERDAPPAVGYAAVLLAASLWGASGVVARTLLQEGISPQTLVALRLSGAAAGGLLYAAARRRPQLRAVWSEGRRIGLLGAYLAATQFAYYAAIASAGVATAIFLQYLAPALLLVWAWAVEGEPLTPAGSAAVALAWCGAFLLVAGPRGLVVNPAGVGWGLASAVLFAAYTLLARRQVTRHDPWAVLALALTAGALLWVVVTPPWDAWGKPYTLSQWLRFLHLVVLATLLPFGLFLYGLRRVSAPRAGLLATWEPVVATVAGYLVLGERLGPLQTLGAALVLAAVGLTYRDRPAAR